MDATLLLQSFLVVVGIKVFLRHEVLGRTLAAEIPLQQIGVPSKEQQVVWSGAVLVAGLALVLKGILGFFS